MKTIVCYGDSNTWGFIPITRERYSREIRWTWIMRKHLGPEYDVIDEGLNGRTTAQDDPLEPGRNGMTYLMPCLLTHCPIDLVVLALGVNNLKKRFSLQASDIAKGINLLTTTIKRSECGPGTQSPEILIVAPPPLGKLTQYAEMFEDGMAKSQRLGAYYKQVAEEQGVHFLDAGEIIVASDLDGIHFEPEEHGKLGQAVAIKVIDILTN